MAVGGRGGGREIQVEKREEEKEEKWRRKGRQESESGVKAWEVTVVGEERGGGEHRNKVV